MADDIIKPSEPNHDVSSEEGPLNRAYMELFSTAPRMKPEDIMTYCGRAVHAPEPDMIMRRSYELARWQYACHNWIKEERERQKLLHQEVAGYTNPTLMSAGQVNQPNHPSTLPDAAVMPSAQQPTFYHSLAQAPVLIAHGTSPNQDTRSSQHDPVQNSTTPQTAANLGARTAHQVPRQAGQEAAQPAPHRVATQPAQPAPHPIATRASHPAPQPQQAPAQYVPRNPLTPSKLRNANAVDPTIVTDARTKILHMMLDKLRQNATDSMAIPVASAAASISRATTSRTTTTDLGSPRKTIDLKKPTSQVVATSPVGNVAQTITQPSRPPLVFSSGSAAASFSTHRTQVGKEQLKDGEHEDEDEDSDQPDITSPRMGLGLLDDQNTATQSQQTPADCPDLSDIIGSETPSEASEDSDTEYTPGDDRSRAQRSTIVPPASRGQPRGRRASLRTTSSQQGVV